MPSIPRMVELGMVPIVAREVVTQFTANTGNVRRFIAHGVPVPLAQEYAAQAGGAKNMRRLIALGVASDLAKEVVS